MSTDETIKKDICLIVDTKNEQKSSIVGKMDAVKPDVKGKKDIKTSFSEREEGELVSESDDADDVVEVSEVNSDKALQQKIVEIKSPFVEEDIIDLSVSQEDINLIGAEENDLTFGDYEEGEVIGNGTEWKREIHKKKLLKKSFENNGKWKNGIKLCAKNENDNNAMEQVETKIVLQQQQQQQQQCDKKIDFTSADDSAEDGEIQSPYPVHSNQTFMMDVCQDENVKEMTKTTAADAGDTAFEQKLIKNIVAVSAMEQVESENKNTVEEACIGSPKTVENESKLACNDENKIDIIKGSVDVSKTVFLIDQQHQKNYESLLKNEKNLNVDEVSVFESTPFIDKLTVEMITSQQYSNKVINFHKNSNNVKQNENENENENLQNGEHSSPPPTATTTTTTTTTTNKKSNKNVIISKDLNAVENNIIDANVNMKNVNSSSEIIHDFKFSIGVNDEGKFVRLTGNPYILQNKSIKMSCQDTNIKSAASFLHCIENVVKNFDGIRKNIVGNKINDILLEVVESKKQKIVPRNEIEKFRGKSITNSIQLTKTSSPKDFRKSAEKTAIDDITNKKYHQKPESILLSTTTTTTTTTAATTDISKRNVTSTTISKILQKVLERPCSSNLKNSDAPTMTTKSPTNIDEIDEDLPFFGPCWLFPSPKYIVSIHPERFDQSPSPRLYRKERKLKIFGNKEKICTKRPKPYDKPELNSISKADGMHIALGCTHLQPYCPYTTKTRIPLNMITLYDERGRLRRNGADICDCGNEGCSGCWYNCFECGSSRCGLSCRCNRQVYPDFWIIKHTKRTTQQH